MKIKVITAGSTSARVGANICPWVMDVPPESKQK